MQDNMTLTATDREILRIYSRLSDAGKLAFKCLVFIYADKNHHGNEEVSSYLDGLRDHSRGEFKRAIRFLREYQAHLNAIEKGTILFTCAEETIAFIRRELIGLEVIA